MSKRLDGRIALITGASRGIGAAVAKKYADEGAHVILAARTVSGLEEVDDYVKQIGGQSTIVPINLLEYDKIDQLGGVIAERFGKLDILVGNAGILGQLAPVDHTDPKVWEKTIAMNLTVNFRLIRSFAPLLNQSQAGRAIFVTSGIVDIESPFWGAYSASKAALNDLVRTYAAEIKKSKVRANIIDPGILRTQMRAEAMPGEKPQSVPAPEVVTERFVQLALANFDENGKIFKGQ